MENEFFREDIIVSRMEKIWNGLYMPRSMVMSQRPYDGLVLIMDDSRDYLFDDDGNGKKMTITADPGNILYLPKGSSYHLSSVTPCKCISFNYTTFSDTATVEPFIMPVGSFMPTYTELFVTADRYWQRRPQGYYAKVMSLLYQVISMMQASYRPDYLPKQLSDRIRQAVEQMNLRYRDASLTVDTLAAECNMSGAYFRRLFVKVCGMPPSKYLKRVRIQRAIELLDSDMYSVADVARMTGFSSPFYFSREFKRITGLAPTRYDQ